MATFVLIHGRADVASSWDLVAAELRQRGHDVVAVDLPCDDESAGLSEYADTVVEAIGERTDLVVVAHSLGGFTAPLVCDRVPVGLLVLVAGMIPAPGETVALWWEDTGHELALREEDVHDDMIATFLHDVPPDLAAQALANARDQAGAPLREPWPLAAWPDVPTRFLLCRDDCFFPAPWLRGLVHDRLGFAPDEIAGGHCPFLSRPQELAERLDAYAAARTGGRP